MSHRHAYGPVIPDAGDDLLKSWDTYVETSTHIIPVGSRDEAQALLASLDASGQAPTPKRPLYFDINGVVYKATGYYPDTGDFTMWPINVTETYRVRSDDKSFNFGRVGGGQRVSLAKDEYWKVMHYPTTVRKHAQTYLVIGQCWTGKHTGNVELELYERPTDDRTRGSKARVVEADDGTTTVIRSGYIAAGEQRDFTMYLHAAPYNATSLDVSLDEWTCMYVQLTPMAM